MKNILVIGAGRFGTYLMREFAAQGDDILVIDSQEERLQKALPFVTSSLITSDGLIRLAAVRSGVLRLSAGDFEEEVSRVSRELGELLKKQTASPSRVGEAARITALQPDPSEDQGS